MEEKNAFETTHKLILQLLSEHKIAGVRVDHVDGLYDPEEYLKQLRKAAPQMYIVVEKILFKVAKTCRKRGLFRGPLGTIFSTNSTGYLWRNKIKQKLTPSTKSFLKQKKIWQIY